MLVRCRNRRNAHDREHPETVRPGGVRLLAEVATALFLCETLGRPSFSRARPRREDRDREAVGEVHDSPLGAPSVLRGLDETRALYEWSYGKQMLYTQLVAEKVGELLREAGDLKSALSALKGQADEFFSRDFLLARPLLSC